jgi:hypothetical protein
MLVRSIQALILFGLAIYFQQAGAAQVLSLQTSAGAISSGATVTVDVRWDAQGGTAPAALQWTVSYSSSDVYLLQTTLATAGVGAGKTLTCLPGFASVTCVLTGSDATSIGNGSVASMTFATTASFTGFTFLSLANSVASSPQGLPIASSASGTGLGVVPGAGLSPAPGCSYALQLTGAVFSARGEAASFSVNTGTQCPWQAQSTVSWMTITTPSAGTGSGTFTFQVAPNAGAARAGTLLITGVALSVIQEASDGSFPQTGFAGGGVAHVVAGGLWKTTITLVNTGSTQGSAHLYFFDNGGNSLPLAWNFPQSGSTAQAVDSLNRTMDPGKTFVMETSDAAAFSEGWAQIQTSGPVQGFAIFTNVQTLQEAVVPIETNGAGLHLLAFDNTSAAETGVALANLSMHSVDVPATFRDPTGATLGSTVIHLEARGHVSFLLHFTFGVTADQRGTMEFDPPFGAQITVVGLRADGPALTTLPILSDPEGDGTGSIAHIVSGGLWKTTLTLVNTRTTTGSASTQWLDDSGAPLTLQIRDTGTGFVANTSSTNSSIPGLSALTLETPPAEPAPFAMGSVQVVAPGINGFAIYKFDWNGQEVAVPLEIRRAGSYFLAFDNTNTLATGVGIANLSGQDAAIPVTIRDDGGSLLRSERILLPAQGHTSFLLTQPYAYTANVRGTIEFGTPPGGRISVIGLRATGAGTLTALPALTRAN